VGGFLREVFYDEGERVYPGAPLARLEIPDLDSQLAQKRAAVREVAAHLRLLEAGPRPEEVAEQRGRVQRAQVWRDLAEQDLARARNVLREELAFLGGLITQWRAEQDYNQEVQKQYARLVGRQAVSMKEFQEAEKQVQVSGSKQQQAQAQQRARQEQGTQAYEAELARREKELADAQSTLRLLEAGTRPEEIEAEQARLARLREEVLYLEGQQAKLQVCSPVVGLITTPRLKEKIGRFLREGDLLCEVEEPSLLEVEVALTEPDAARVSPDQTVDLKARALPFQTFRARVDRIAPRALRGEPGAVAAHLPPGELPATVTVYCRIEETETGLRPGMTGHARISCGQRSLGELLADRALRFLRTEFWW
jgi:putative peptide zinc metalloprotease protein